MAEFNMSVIVRQQRLIVGMKLPVADMLWQLLASSNTSELTDAEYQIFIDFKDQLLDGIREMK